MPGLKATSNVRLFMLIIVTIDRTGNLNEILARQAGVQIRWSGGLGSESRISVRGLERKRMAK